MPAIKGQAPPRSRASVKELRRQQLIEATVTSIAKRGFADTTTANVAKEAKLAHGTVNFHFTSKKQLLVETLRFLAEEYRAVWLRAHEQAGPDAADRLAALLLADFDPAVCNRKKIAVWHAFYGEAKSRPTYLEICSARDKEHWEVSVGLVGRIIEEGGYDHLDPARTTRGLDAITDGLWLDMLLAPRKLDREEARQTLLTHLAAVFPGHFPRDRRRAA